MTPHHSHRVVGCQLTDHPILSCAHDTLECSCRTKNTYRHGRLSTVGKSSIPLYLTDQFYSTVASAVILPATKPPPSTLRHPHHPPQNYRGAPVEQPVPTKRRSASAGEDCLALYSAPYHKAHPRQHRIDGRRSSGNSKISYASEMKSRMRHEKNGSRH